MTTLTIAGVSIQVTAKQFTDSHGFEAASIYNEELMLHDSLHFYSGIGVTEQDELNIAALEELLTIGTIVTYGEEGNETGEGLWVNEFLIDRVIASLKRQGVYEEIKALYALGL